MLVVAAAALYAAGAATSAAGTPTARSAPSIVWGGCPDPAVNQVAQCGSLSVPLDYANPTGQQIQLEVLRASHTTAHYQGIILANPGGPGASGLYAGLSLEQTLLHDGFAAAAAGYDWIGFDPRGVGASRPAISCIPNYFRPDRPSYVPRTRALLRYWLSQSRAYAQACQSKSPLQAALLRHMTTPDVARDMDSIRAALGQGQINYYGFSYGTYLGQVYATLFPTHVRRLILDSNVNPLRAPYQSGNLDQDVPFNRNTGIWFGWLARYDRVYHLGHTRAAVRKLFFKTEASLLRHPAGGRIGPDEWEDLFLGAAYEQSNWPTLGQAFADWVHGHSRHAIGELIADYRRQDAPGNDNSFAGYLAVQCTDAPWPTSWKTWSRDTSAAYRRAPFGTWANAWFNAPCIYWPAPPATPVHVDGSQIASALLIDETLDAPTPFPGSLVVRNLFPHAVLVAEPGGTSHADSLSPLAKNACVDGTVAAYLATGALPPRKPQARWDKTCPPLPTPVPGTMAHSALASNGVVARQPGRFGTALGFIH